MSWEGYYQLICKNKHYWTESAEYREVDECRCPICKELPKWYHIVDITNGSFEGEERIDGYIEPSIATQKKCDKCGSILERTYNVPRGFRKYEDRPRGVI